MKYNDLINYQSLINSSYGGHLDYLYDNIKQDAEILYNLNIDESTIIDIWLWFKKYATPTHS